jgi:hypothetical protein
MKDLLTQNKISQYIAYGSPFIIFLGMVRLIIFYNSFGISITDYLDFSEIITSFFDIIVLVVVFFGIALIQSFLIRDKEKLERANAKRQEILKEENYFKLWWLYVKYLKGLIAITFLVIVGCVIGHFWFSSVTIWALFLTSSALVFLIFVIVTSVEIERKDLQFNATIAGRRFIYFVLYGLAITFCVSSYSFYQANSIMKDKTNIGVTIILSNDKAIVSDSSNYYIGKTKNYLFIYHEKEKTTDVYPIARIKQMTMPNKKKLGFNSN